jgi:alanine dehydrogenase
MPGAVPITATHALTNATLPYAVALADRGVEGAIRQDPGLRPGVNVAAGQVTHPAVAEAVGMSCVPVEQALQIDETPADGTKSPLGADQSARRPQHVEVRD